MQKSGPLLALLILCVSGCAQLSIPFFNGSSQQAGLGLKYSGPCPTCPAPFSAELSSKQLRIGDPFTILGTGSVSELELWLAPLSGTESWKTIGVKIATVSASGSFDYSAKLEAQYDRSGRHIEIESGHGYQFILGDGTSYYGFGMTFSVP